VAPASKLPVNFGSIIVSC